MKEILLLEGTAALLAARMKTLETEGYHVTGATTATEAARALRRMTWDVVVVDAGIPEILEPVSSSAIPAVIMADEEAVVSVTGGLPAGLWTLLVKPITAKKLKQAVARAIDQADKIKDVMQQRVLLPLNSTSQLLVSEAQIERFFKHLVELTAAQTEADRVSLLLHDIKTGRLTVKAELGEPDTGNDETLGQLLTGTDEPLVVNSRAEASTRIKETMSQMGAARLLGIPLVTRDKVLGVITAIKTEKGGRFSSGNLEFLTILARHAAIAIENAALFRSIEEQRIRLERLLEKTCQAQDDERKRVAVDIHDGIGQQMISVMYRLQALNQLLSESKLGEARAEAEEIRTVLGEAVKELRRILAGLHPQALDELGLVAALQREVDRLNLKTETPCRFQVEGAAVELAPGREAAVYRIVQEALNNIVKHAHATSADVQLRFEPKSISVKISDNGKGFNLDGATNGIPLGHLGLIGMKERAEMLGGKLIVESNVEQGTSILLVLPINHKEAEIATHSRASG